VNTRIFVFTKRKKEEAAEGNANDRDYDDNGDDPIQDIFS
jgi:hypothetical protein